MNIVGEGFPKEINEQVKTRQKIHGYGYLPGTSRDTNMHLYKNANSAWCRLVSSTDITNLDDLVNSNIGSNPVFVTGYAEYNVASLEGNN